MFTIVAVIVVVFCVKNARKKRYQYSNLIFKSQLEFAILVLMYSQQVAEEIFKPCLLTYIYNI